MLEWSLQYWYWLAGIAGALGPFVFWIYRVRMRQLHSIFVSQSALEATRDEDKIKRKNWQDDVHKQFDELKDRVQEQGIAIKNLPSKDDVQSLKLELKELSTELLGTQRLMHQTNTTMTMLLENELSKEKGKK